jgi:VIT1/CCC1 family predicted Fe2+/Mn2+ transporter
MIRDMTAQDEHFEHGHGDTEGLGNRLNWLRAGVLGANDGIVSVAGLVMGVAGATDSRSAIVIAGVAALVAGALSMGAGEYVSVSTQRDAELALIQHERRDLEKMPEQELHHLASILEGKGIESELAVEVARQLSGDDPLRAHAEFEFGIDIDDVTSPWRAAAASMGAFTLGALLPVLTILLPSPERFYVTAAAVAAALAVTGHVSAKLGFARPWPAVVRNVLGGLFAMGITLLVGYFVGGAVA